MKTLKIAAAVAVLAGGSGLAVSALVQSAHAQGAAPQLTREVLVTTGAVQVTSTWEGRGGVEILNLGPNDLWCGIGASARAVLNKSRRIKTDGTWAVDLGPKLQIWCLAATANQVTGAATIVNEVP